MNDLAKAGKPREILRSAVVALAVTIATLAALEIFLRIADFRELREGVNERSLSYRHDAELGWFPAPNSSSVVTNARTFPERIPFVSFDGAGFYPGASEGTHWTPEGHKLVAERVLGPLSENKLVPAGVRAPE